MARKTFSVSDLHSTLDSGKVAVVFQAALRRAVRDCADRPTDVASRKVTLTMMLRPKPDSSKTQCDAVDVQFKVTSSVPHEVTRTYEMAVGRDGHLIFNAASDDDVHQSTLDDLRKDITHE